MLMLTSASRVADKCVSSGAGAGQPAKRFFVTPARNLHNMAACGTRGKDSQLSNQHRLLGEDTRHRALR
jgi:hypothetical protein